MMMMMVMLTLLLGPPPPTPPKETSDDLSIVNSISFKKQTIQHIYMASILQYQYYLADA